MSVQADSIGDAVDEAVRRVSTAVERSGLPSWPFVQATALTANELERDLARPAIPVLLEVAELAERLGEADVVAGMSDILGELCERKPQTGIPLAPGRYSIDDRKSHNRPTHIRQRHRVYRTAPPTPR
jgi:hypothetical protein